MSAAENLILAHGLTPYLIAFAGALIGALCVVATFVVKLLIKDLKNEVIFCRKELMSRVDLTDAFAKQTRKITDDNAQDMQSHINEHHTK